MPHLTEAIVVRSRLAAERSSWAVGVLVGWWVGLWPGENCSGQFQAMWWLLWT